MPALGSPAALANTRGSFFPGRAPSILDRHFWSLDSQGPQWLGAVRVSAGIPSKVETQGENCEQEAVWCQTEVDLFWEPETGREMGPQPVPHL